MTGSRMGTASGGSRAHSRGRGPQKEGLSTVVNRHRVKGVISDKQGPGDEETASIIEEWLHIPNLSGETEEDIVARSEDPGNITDDFFPPSSDSINDPTLPEMGVEIEWRRMKGSVYLPQLHSVKISKGERSTPWFLGALAAVACRQDLLLDLIVSDDLAEYGLYTFQFYKHGIWHQVVVDDSIPFKTSSDQPFYCSSAYDGELWPSLLEKAYAKVHGSYGALEAGSVEEALVDLTGGSAFMLDLSQPQWQEEAANGQLWMKLIQYNSWGYIIACVMESTGAEPNSEGQGNVYLNHAYSILDVKQTSSGLQLLRMHNPWLGGNWSGPWCDNSPEWSKPENAGLAEELGYEFEDDGTFWISFWDFMHSFNRVNVARLFPPSWHQLTLHSGWIDSTAGGPPGGLYGGTALSPTWCCNPQFRITVRKPAELLLCISQRDPQITYGGYVHEDEREIQFGCVVLQDNADETARRWHFDPDEALAILGPTGSRDVTASLQVVPHQSYLIIPFTSIPQQNGAFVIRTFSSAPLEVEQLPSPMQLEMSDSWQGWTAGGNRGASTWGSNPQFLLTSPQRTTVLVSVVRPEHTDPPAIEEEEEENADFIGFSLTRPDETDDGLGRCLTVDNDSQVVYEADSESSTCCAALVQLEPDMPYIFTPCTQQPSLEGQFNVSIIGSSPVELIPFPKVHSVTLRGEWGEENAGGCDLNPSWKKNPKFVLSTQMPGQFRITIRRLGKKWKKGSGLDNMIGFYLLKTDSSTGEITDYKNQVIAEAPFVPMNMVEQEYPLAPGSFYVLMPTVYAPQKFGKFTVSITSELDFDFQDIADLQASSATFDSPMNPHH